VQLPHDLERGEHVLPGVRVLAPADAAEQVLGHSLTGPKTVEDSAATETPCPQPVVDGAGKVLVKVLAGRSRRLVYGEVCRTCEAEGRAA
jgi:hypothetical protein